MLSVGNRDGGKGLGFGEDMEDTELEEGEACSYMNDDPTVDPDISLAYLDEKLHSVLGHFQKDFEGGVSAENLGAKFGGYGSFLPTYQRSPVGSHPRTPKIQNHGLRSPSNLQLEGGCHTVTTPEVAVLSVHCHDVNNVRTVSGSKTSTTRCYVKLDTGMEHGQAKKLISRTETFKKSTLIDSKKLKVRIKVGSDNLSARTKAEIYNGLGLHASPSSSFEDSPQSEGWSRELHDAPDESLNSILHIMTSFPLERSMLLSPLAEDLSYLVGNKNLTRNKKTQRLRIPDSISKSEAGKSARLSVGPVSSLNAGKLPEPKNNMSLKISGFLLDLRIGGTGNGQYISKLSKDTHDEASCEQLITKALRLPLLSTSEIPVSNGKISGMFLGTQKSEVSSVVSKMEPSDNCADIRAGDNLTGGVGFQESFMDQKVNFVGEIEAQPGKHFIREGTIESPTTEMSPSIGVKGVKKESTHILTSTTDTKVELQKVGSISANMDISSSKAKSKSKMTPGDTNTTGTARVQSREEASFQSRFEKKSTRGSKSEAKISKLQSDVRKSRDTYKELFGDLNLDHEENEIKVPLEFPSAHEIKGSHMTDNGKAIGKKVEMPIISESHSKTESHAVPLVSSQMLVAPPPTAPVVIEEHWVCCDNCQKWRLLPFGRLPNSLPEKWLCSMLDWLPGMNRCDIEEDDTTKALVSFYQASAVPEGDKKTHGSIDGIRTGPLPAVIQHPRSKDNSAASILKKKNGLTETPIPMSSQGPASKGDLETHFQPTIKSRSWNDARQSPSVPDLNNLHLKEPSDLMVEKNKKLNKDKLTRLDRSLDEGSAGLLKANKKRNAGRGSPRPSKKYKNEDPPDEGWISEMDHHIPYRIGGLNNHSKATEAKSHSDHDTSLTSSIKDRVRHSNDCLSDKRSDGIYSSGKKRKSHSSQESRHSESLPISGLKPEKEKEFCQKYRGKVKKSKVSGKEISVSHPKKENIAEKSDHPAAKNLRMARDANNSSTKQSMVEMDSPKRVLTSSHVYMEATSSSSKISGSHKSKANLQVTEGSPVESVSSSPLRSRSKDKRTSNGRNNFPKECPSDLSVHSVSPKRYSDHETNGKMGGIGSVRKGTCSMEKASVVAHFGSSSVLDFRDSASGSKIKGKPAACDELPSQHSVNEVANTLDDHAFEKIPSDNGLGEEACNNTLYLSNGSLPDKKGSAVRSIDMLRKSKLDSLQEETRPNEDKVMDDNLSKHTAAESHRLEKKHDMKVLGENCTKSAEVKSGGGVGQGVKHHGLPSSSASMHNLVSEYEGTSNSLPPEKMELPDTRRGKSVLRSPIVGGSSMGVRDSHHTSGTCKGDEIENRNVEPDDSLKGSKAVRKADKQNGGQPTTSNKGLNAPSPARRDSSSQSAANAVKEAKTLKHMADRVKSSVSNAESIGLYFQASLKFLLGASLLESSTSETRHVDMIQSTQMYSSTAKLCEFCANEYEKAKDMASAALAYKCTEVAYMRVVYSSRNNANRDRHELQNALQMAPPGESPSSSASDVDNLNNAATGDKVHVAKGVSSPQVASSHVISARNRPGFARLLNFAQDVNFAMEASRKSRVALAAVNAHFGQVHNEDGISSIKRALDFSFQDVEGLLRLIRLAMEAITR